MKDRSSNDETDFAEQAEKAGSGLIGEFWAFISCYKKWWLIPILIVLGLVGLLVILSSSAIAPFIYPLF